MMFAAAPCARPNVPPPLRTDFKEEELVHVIKRIGFVAACIDLHDWRNVIDEVLSEVEAENEARILELEIESPWPLPPEAAVFDGSAVLPRPAS
jgi:hypothetical protein